MGKADNTMDRRHSGNDKVGCCQGNRHSTNNSNNTIVSDGTRPSPPRSRYHTLSSSENEHATRLSASTSSPSLLDGCSDSNTHLGSEIERHVQAHNVIVDVSQNPPLSPIPVSPTLTSDEAPFPLIPSSSDIPDAVFLTPSPPRPRHLLNERPSSAPSNYLERISGTLLRLVGDHYLCSTCGRQLRTIGDQLTIETSINHITRALSAGHLDRSDN